MSETDSTATGNSTCWTHEFCYVYIDFFFFSQSALSGALEVMGVIDEILTFDFLVKCIFILQSHLSQ